MTRVDDCQWDTLDELTLYEAKHGKKEDKEKDGKSEEEEEVVLPAKLVLGVSLTLCGLFLVVIPIPACKPLGQGAIALGLEFCADSICTRIDENNQKGKK